MNQIQKQKEAYYKQQGIAPGVPTMKGAYGDLHIPPIRATLINIKKKQFPVSVKL